MLSLSLSSSQLQSLSSPISRFTYISAITHSIPLRCMYVADVELKRTPTCGHLSRKARRLSCAACCAAHRYRNLDGKGTFSGKIVINANALGAYSLVAFDVDQD
eukprot:6204423-Pleurochrysis_carterae.AAC.5